MKFKSLFFVFVLPMSLIACSDETDRGIADAVTQIQPLTINNKIHLLILRTSGFQDKVSFYELYENLPLFDACGRTNANPIATVEIEENENPSKLIIENRRLHLIYLKNKTPIADLSKILVELK